MGLSTDALGAKIKELEGECAKYRQWVVDTAKILVDRLERDLSRVKRAEEATAESLVKDVQEVRALLETLGAKPRTNEMQYPLYERLGRMSEIIALVEKAPSVKAPRFVLRSIYEMSPEDRERLGVNLYGYGQLLEDTFTGEYWTDGGEPEDASFYRDYAWVPAKLNELAAESARSVEVLLEVVKMLQELLLAVEQQTRAPE